MSWASEVDQHAEPDKNDNCEIPECKVLNKHSWSSGITGKLSIVVPEDTRSWEMSVTFDKAINRLEAYEGRSVQCSGKTCTFKNQHWNGQNKAGDNLTLGFQGHGRFLDIVSFAFNGVTCYGEGANCNEKRAEEGTYQNDILFIGCT